MKGRDMKSKADGYGDFLEAWSSIVEEANRLGLVEFVFKYKGKLYISTWTGLRWREPYQVQELK
jgi:hypothetical protein